MRDVYDAIGCPGLMAMGNRTEAPGCLVEQAVNAALDTSFQDAEALLLARFGEVTLAALAADFHARMAARSPSPTTQEQLHGCRRPTFPRQLHGPRTGRALHRRSAPFRSRPRTPPPPARAPARPPRAQTGQ